jgi:hypothetical protein
MNDLSTAESTVEYKVVLAVPVAQRILIVAEKDTFRLPRVHIPRWTRPAEEITRELRGLWNLSTVILNLQPSKNSRLAYALAEVLSYPANGLDSALCLRSLDELLEIDLDAFERAEIGSFFSADKKHTGPFSRLGWLTDARGWIQDNLRAVSVELGDDFRQYNAGDTFALVRFAARNGGAYWFKATGKPNAHEFAVTVALSELFPRYLPRLVAKRDDWNAWVMEDGGTSLGATRDVGTLSAAVGAFADLQLQSLGHISRLEVAGCLNRRLSGLQGNLREMFAYLGEAMGHQTSTKVIPLTSSRLDEIHCIVAEACDRMQELSIPDCLVNGDINLDNILYDDQRFRFTDWAEAGIGNPFLTLQQVIQHVIREGEHLEWTPRICSAYKKKWLALLTERQIDRAFALMPLLTIADYLHGRGDWLRSSRRGNPSFQGFARTLGRCMDRAAMEFSSAEGRRV